MRKIKFRTWDKDFGVWHYFHIPFKIGDLLPNNAIRYINFCQFTGLKDKNGKEIYEGDILTVWIEGDKQTNPRVVDDLRELYKDCNDSDNYYRITATEIIGNIHENPELLINK